MNFYRQTLSSLEQKQKIGETDLLKTAEHNEPIVVRAFSEIGQFLYHLSVPRYSRGAALFSPLRLLESQKKISLATLY